MGGRLSLRRGGRREGRSRRRRRRLGGGDVGMGVLKSRDHEYDEGMGFHERWEWKV